MEFLARNIVFLRRRMSLTQEQLASRLGVTRSCLANYENGISTPREESLRNLAAKLNISIEALVSEDLALSESDGGISRVLAVTVSDDGDGNIEFVPVKAAAGYTVGYGDPEYIRELPRFRLPFLSKGRYRAFEIEGDSMLPIPSGSVVVGQYVESLQYIKKGDAYIFVTLNEGIVFKRVADIGKGRIILQSDNRLYSSYGLPLSEIREVWKTKVYMMYQIPELDKSLGRLEWGGEVN